MDEVDFVVDWLLGQSFTTGKTGGLALTTSPPYPSNVFEIRRNGPGFPVPLYEGTGFDTGTGERPSSALAKSSYESGPPESKVVLITFGQGGKNILQLSALPASEHMETSQAFINWCVANGKTCRFRNLHYMEGEASHQDGLSIPQYNAAQLALYNYFNDNIQAKMSAAGMPQGPIRMVQNQMDAWTNASGKPRIGLAQLNASRIFDWYTLVGSHCDLPRSDGPHLTNWGYRYLGERHHRATQPGHKPVAPYRITRSGLIVSISCYGVEALEINTSLGAVQNYNIRTHDTADPYDLSTSSVSINSVAVSGLDIVLGLSAEPAGDLWLSNGWIDQQSNIRDSDPFVSSYDGTPLPGWLCHFRDPIGLDLS